MAEADQDSIGNHVVCIIDILGQKQKLAAWTKLEQDRGTLIDALKRTAGTVVSFRNSFKDFFAQLDRELPEEKAAALTPEGREIFRRFRESSLKTQQFSDTFVFYSPVHNSHGDISPEPFYRCLSACGMAMLYSLAGKVAIRGGICVAPGIEIEEGNFYGPGIAIAHQLESEVAQYPRVVVDNEAASFMAGRQHLSDHPLLNMAMNKALHHCGGFVCKDDDGRYIVDFMGETMRSIAGLENPQHLEWIKAAYEFVCGEIKQFQETGDAKLLERFARLKRYIDARLPLWGIDPISL